MKVVNWDVWRGSYEAKIFEKDVGKGVKVWVGERKS